MTAYGILDLALVPPGGTPRDALLGAVTLARAAEEAGFARVWYAEHHNMPTIASAAPAVLIAHVAAHTRRIRLGAGGVMLPNHSPLVVAEQFGTLEALHPGRIDLGLGRAPGTDPGTARALRRGLVSDDFDDRLAELRGYLGGAPPGAGQVPFPAAPTDAGGADGRRVRATPGNGSNIPIYILGSSTYGADVAAREGLPFAFASHFAPTHLHEALSRYRRGFRPTASRPRPYAFAAVNVVVAEDTETAEAHARAATRLLTATLLAGGAPLDDATADALYASPAAAPLRAMGRYTFVGTADAVRAQLAAFAADTEADELILSLRVVDGEARVRAAQLLGAALR